VASDVARIFPPKEQQNPYAGCSYLGPAEVVASGPTIELALADGSTVEATAALAFSYEPAKGDVVVAIGNERGFYVIGVVASQGPAALSVRGDLSVCASGKLELRGEEGVAIEGRSMDVRVGKLRLLANAVTERFQTVRQHVAELLSVQAGQSHTVVDGAAYTRAESSTLLTEKNVTVNGKAIYLG